MESKFSAKIRSLFFCENFVKEKNFFGDWGKERRIGLVIWTGIVGWVISNNRVAVANLVVKFSIEFSFVLFVLYFKG
jgi:Ca2+-dependent lipid-binding protein